nr:reverse transcriptase domain-containing protein [Tanacetum cinerariifolium]
MIRAVRINIPLVDVLAGMPNYRKFLKELISNKHKIEQILSAFLSDESSAILQNKVPPKLGDPGSFLIPCNFNKAFSCNALAELGAIINLMPYSLYAKLSLKTFKPTKMSVRLADRSFQYPVGIAENILVEVGKFTFHSDFVILEMEEDRVGIERMIFHIDLTMKDSYSNDDTCFSIDVIYKILEEYFDAFLEEGSEILHSIEGTILEEKLFAEFASTSRYVVPTGRVVVPTGRVVVPTGSVVVPTDRVVVPTGRVVVPTGSNFINFLEKWSDFRRAYLLRYNELRVVPARGFNEKS